MLKSRRCPDLPSPVGRERRDRPLMEKRVFRVAAVKGCPDAGHPACCPLTFAPAPASFITQTKIVYHHPDCGLAVNQLWVACAALCTRQAGRGIAMAPDA